MSVLFRFALESKSKYHKKKKNNKQQKIRLFKHFMLFTLKYQSSCHSFIHFIVDKLLESQFDAHWWERKYYESQSVPFVRRRIVYEIELLRKNSFSNFTEQDTNRMVLMPDHNLNRRAGSKQNAKHRIYIWEEFQLLHQSRTSSTIATFEQHFYSPCLRWAGEWVKSVAAKHAGAGLGDAIIKIYCGKHKCD